MSSRVRIPVIANAIELAEYIMEKRAGSRIYYDATTSPTLNEVNERLLSNELSVTKEINNQWMPDSKTEEVRWVPYQGNSNFWTRGSAKVYVVEEPRCYAMTNHPIISVEHIYLMINNVETDLVASADYTEGWDEDYYIDYRNGIIEFRHTYPKFATPIKVEYTYGRYESNDGYRMQWGVITAASQTTVTSVLTSTTGRYNGKLMKITSGTASGNLYRILDSTNSSTNTAFTLGDAIDFSEENLTTDGILPRVYSYQECGLSGKTSTTETGLTKETKYYFKIDTVEYDITTGDGTGDTLKYAAILLLLNAATTGIATWTVTGGDLRCTLDTYTTDITLADGTSGDNLFDGLTGFLDFDTNVDHYVGDEYEIYCVPGDIKEMILISTYLGILIGDPTYQHNFTNPFDAPNPQYAQFQWLAMKYSQLTEQRKNKFQLVN